MSIFSSITSGAFLSRSNYQFQPDLCRVTPSKAIFGRTFSEDLKIKQQRYHGGAIVGNDCEKLLDHFDLITNVLANYPEEKIKFDECFTCYEKIARLMKAKRWLKPEEIVLLEKECK